MRSFHLEIVTPYGSVFDGDAESLLVRTEDGDVEIMCGHADYVAAVGVGRTRIIKDGKSYLASSAGGFLTVQGGEVRLVTVTFEYADDIDLERARRAMENASRSIKGAESERDVRLAKAKLARAMNRIKISESK